MEDNQPKTQATTQQVQAKGGYKLFTDSVSNHMAIATLIAADLSKT
jgi:hypothetical protein